MSKDLKNIFLQTEASGYDDEILMFVGKNIDISRGYVDYDYDKLALKFQKSADEAEALCNTYQIKHNINRNFVIKAHAHVIVPSDDNFKFFIKWRKWKNNDFAGAWSSPTEGVYMFPKIDGKLNVITFEDIDISDCNVSDMIDIKFYRDDSVNKNAWLKQADFHVRKKNITGSFNEWGD